MCPSAPRVCSEPGGQKPVLSLSLDRITKSLHQMWNWRSSAYLAGHVIPDLSLVMKRPNRLLYCGKDISEKGKTLDFRLKTDCTYFIIMDELGENITPFLMTCMQKSVFQEYEQIYCIEMNETLNLPLVYVVKWIASVRSVCSCSEHDGNNTDIQGMATVHI